jgi:K+/H+ antiporter YhaU regulatory subunit KhtT
MNLLRSTQRALFLGFDGVREALVVVAERLALRVQVGKLQLQADAAEGRLREAYESLGQHLFRCRQESSQNDPPLESTLPLTERIRTEHQLVQDLRDRLTSLSDETLLLPLSHLQEDLRAGGGTIERLTISPGALADGKRLADLSLPHTVRFVALRRGEDLLIPSGDLVLQAGDEITLLGARSAIPPALKILRT